MTHICVSKLTIIGSDKGLSPGRYQATIGASFGILPIGPLGTNFSQFLTEIHTFSFKNMHLKLSSGKCRPFCRGPNVFSDLLQANMFSNEKSLKRSVPDSDILACSAICAFI